MSDQNKPVRKGRRSILQMTAMAGGLGVLPSSAVAKGEREQNTNHERTSIQVLGDFEDGLDQWTTTGNNSLERVNSDDFPVGVTSGEYALAVEIEGDMHPMIENKQRVKDADFLEHPYLGVHVLGQATDTDSKLLFRFRLHHTSAEENGNGRTGSSRSKSENVVESEWKAVTQLKPQRLQWDMSGLSDAVRETAKRLEIVWYLEDHEPQGGHRGRNNGSFDYEGIVVVDDIRLSETALLSEAQRRNDKERDLHRAHGMIIERNFEERRDDFIRGTLVYVDGTEVSFSSKVLDRDRFKYTIDGETFRIGGGWE